MANTTFKLRRSSVAGKAPNTSTISIGELALNLTDRKLYSSDGTNIFETGSNLTSLSVFSTLSVGNSTVNTVVNSTALSVKSIVANGGIGSANQVLTSNGTGIYWTSGGSGTVTSVATGNGVTGGPITSTGTVSVLANNGITANSTGLFVTQGTGTVVNATGVHVNSSYINTISSNSAVFLTGNTITTNSTVLSVGSNVSVSASTLSIGNSTVNTVANSTTFAINGNNISPVQSFRNKIINGNFDFWQRSTSSSTAGYIDDRWSSSASGSTFTTSRQSFTLGQTSVPNEPTYFHRTAVTSSAGSGNYVAIEQRIESVKTLAGQTATLSFWAKADASKNIAVEFSQVFGTGGSPSSAVTGIGVTTCALTTTWTKFTINVTISSISGKTLGSNNDDYLRLSFWFDAGSTYNSRNNSLGQQSGTFDIAQVQLEAGSVATPFEMRPFGVELALCQRYYQTHLSMLMGSWGSTTTVYNDFMLPVEMRAAPTASLSNQTYSSGSGGAINSALKDHIRISFIVTVGGGYGYTVFDLTTSAEL